MIRTIWLASYPKSGNTWLRVLLANATAMGGQPVNINRLPSDGAGARDVFDYIGLIDSDLLTDHEIDCLRPSAYAALTRGAPEDELGKSAVRQVRFLKVHDAYTLNSAGEPLLGGSQAASGAIVIVRDPRDVAVSFANHANTSVDKAIAFMNNEDATLGEPRDRQHNSLLTKLRDWSGHIASWVDQVDLPVHLTRYEDLRKDTFGTLRKICAFAGLEAGEEQLSRAVAFSDFAQLQQQEQQGGFIEAPSWKSAKFFYRGKVGYWRDELTHEQIARLESRHWWMMQRLGYELSHVSNLARAG